MLFGSGLQEPLPRWKDIATMMEFQTHGRWPSIDLCESGIFLKPYHEGNHPSCLWGKPSLPETSGFHAARRGPEFFLFLL